MDFYNKTQIAFLVVVTCLHAGYRFNVLQGEKLLQVQAPPLNTVKSANVDLIPRTEPQASAIPVTMESTTNITDIPAPLLAKLNDLHLISPYTVALRPEFNELFSLTLQETEKVSELFRGILAKLKVAQAKNCQLVADDRGDTYAHVKPFPADGQNIEQQLYLSLVEIIGEGKAAIVVQAVQSGFDNFGKTAFEIAIRSAATERGAGSIYLIYRHQNAEGLMEDYREELIPTDLVRNRYGDVLKAVQPNF